MEVQYITCKKRKCGKREEEGIYLVTGSRTSPDGVLPLFICIEPPIPHPGQLHRGPIIVDGRAILARRPYEEWLAGSSKERFENQQGDAWVIETFGMTRHRRLSMGECKGMKGLDFAMAHLVSKMVWDNRVINFIRNLTILEVPNLPRAAEPFSKLVRAAQTCAKYPTSGPLMEIQAAVWQLADSIPPKKKSDVYPYLRRILIVINLPADALELKETS